MSLRVRQEEDLRWIDCEFDAQHALHMTDSGKRCVDEVGCVLVSSCHNKQDCSVD